MFRLFLFSFLFLPIVLAEKEPAVRIFFSANRQGEIEPCGCQVNQIGGLNRFKAFLDEDKKKVTADALLVDSGDTFFSVNPLNETRKEQELDRARLIAQVYQLMKLDAFSPGERDFAGGIEMLRELQRLSGAKFLTTNILDKSGNTLFERSLVIERGGLKIGLFSLADEKAFSGVSDVKVLPPGPILKQMVEEFKKQKVEKVVLLSHLGLPQDRELAGMGGLDAILGSHSLDITPTPEVVNGAGIMQPQNEGQQIGIFDLFAASGKMEGHLVDLSKNYDVRNEVSKLMSRYKAKIREIAIAQESPTFEATQKRPYVANAQTCRKCHQEQYKWWANTKHASAYLVLYAKNQHFDPECISCHSLGFQKDGGFARISHPIVLKSEEKADKKQLPFVEQLMAKVFSKDPGKGPLDSRLDPARYAVLKQSYHDQVKILEEQGKIRRLFIGVQCEHCHGNRQGHPSPKVATLKKVNRKACLECHKPPNAPEWDEPTLQTKIKEIGCPRLKKS